MYMSEDVDYRKWVISVISTDKDLSDIRKAVIDFLSKKKEIDVLAFELPRYPIEPNLHSHDVCLTAVKNSNISIIIIDRRYGGLYVHRGEGNNVSITESEYQTIVDDKDIVKLVFVNSKTNDETIEYSRYVENVRSEYPVNPDEQMEKEIEEIIDKTYVCKYVEDINVLKFVRKIHKSKINNFLSFYDDVDTLLYEIEGKLVGLSRYYCDKIIEKQSEYIMRQKTESSVFISLSDLIKSSLYVEPSILVRSSDESLISSSLDETIFKSLTKQTNILLIGNTGSGKSSALSKAYLNHYNNHVNYRESYSFPLYLQLGTKKSYSFSLQDYFKDAFNEYLNMELYPYFNEKCIQRYYFYIDSFDELMDQFSTSDLRTIVDSEIFRYPHILSCRSNIAKSYLRDPFFSNDFTSIIELKEWDDKQILEFITLYYNKWMENKSIPISVIKDKLLKKPLGSFTSNPLLISLILWIIDVSPSYDLDLSFSLDSLFEKVVVELAKREIVHNNKMEINPYVIVEYWGAIAWGLYHARITQKRLTVSDLSNDKNVSRLNIPENIQLKVLNTIFYCTPFNEINGVIHEQFLEYLVGRYIYNSCIFRNNSYPYHLEFAVKPEINRFFRLLFISSHGDIQNAILSNLFSHYKLCFSKNDNTSILRRAQIAAHLARMCASDSEIYRNIKMYGKLEKENIPSLSLYYGLVKRGELEIEEELFDKLDNDNSFNSISRGFQLVYNGDRSITVNSIDFTDDLSTAWDKTYQSLEQHIVSDDKEYYFLRRVDLLVMRSFIETRNSIDGVNLDLISSHLESKYDYQHPDFARKVKKEYERLKSVFDNLNL